MHARRACCAVQRRDRRGSAHATASEARAGARAAGHRGAHRPDVLCCAGSRRESPAEPGASPIDSAAGERLLSAGRSEDAAVHLEHALTRFEALGAVGWTERARRAIGVATGSAREAQPRRTDALTAQELRARRAPAAGCGIARSPPAVPQPAYGRVLPRKCVPQARCLKPDAARGILAADGIRPVGVPARPVPQDP